MSVTGKPASNAVPFGRTDNGNANSIVPKQQIQPTSERTSRRQCFVDCVKLSYRVGICEPHSSNSPNPITELIALCLRTTSGPLDVR